MHYNHIQEPDIIPIGQLCFNDHALPPVRIDELREKTNLLIKEYSQVSEKNRNLGEKLENIEKVKAIICTISIFWTWNDENNFRN